MCFRSSWWRMVCWGLRSVGPLLSFVIWPDSYKVLGFQIYALCFWFMLCFWNFIGWVGETIVSVSPSEMDTLPAFRERSSFDSQFPYVYGRFPTLVTCSGTHRLAPWEHSSLRRDDIYYIFQRDCSDDVLYATMQYSRVFCWHEANFAVLH